MLYSIFFPQKGTEISQLAADCQSENYLMCNAQIQKVVVYKSLNKMLTLGKIP